MHEGPAPGLVDATGSAPEKVYRYPRAWVAHTGTVTLDRFCRSRLAVHPRWAGVLASLAVTDGLTGLENRRSFDIRMSNEWQRAVRGAAPLVVHPGLPRSDNQLLLEGGVFPRPFPARKSAISWSMSRRCLSPSL